MSTRLTPPFIALVAVCLYGCGSDSELRNPCATITCSGHGTCVVESDTARCDCDDGYAPAPVDAHECVVELNPPDLETIMADAHLVQRVDLEATVDLDGILASDLGATREGDFVWWEESLSAYDDGVVTECGDIAYLSDEVRLRYAVGAEGLYFVGVLGPPARALAALMQFGSGMYHYTTTYPTDLLQQYRYYPGISSMDFRWTVLYITMWTNYERLASEGLCEGGPPTNEVFYDQEFSIENRFDRPIYVLYAANICCASVNGCTNDTPANDYWCPRENTDDFGLGARGFDLAYESQSHSLLVLFLGTDESNDARILLDDAIRNQCSGPYGSTVAITDEFPYDVELTATRAYSQYYIEFVAFFVADDVSFSNVWQQPLESVMSENPPPLLDVLQPGWNF